MNERELIFKRGQAVEMCFMRKIFLRALSYVLLVQSYGIVSYS